MNPERIPFQVEISRIVELLAKQIYQSPLALVRENTQNAYDAILQRLHTDRSFAPEIRLLVSPSQIVVQDNGIGMTKAELVQNYWRAGASGKNTPEARAAGVVGTFGIGAMANFGVASILEVETESALTAERTRCVAVRETLSVTDDCIDIVPLEATGLPGTVVKAMVPANASIDVDQASKYLKECVRYLPIPVFLNEVLVSQQDFDASVPRPTGESVTRTVLDAPLGRALRGNLEIVAARVGEVWIAIRNIRDANTHVPKQVRARSSWYQFVIWAGWYGKS
jgi:molecular chaperone HtpG